MSWFRRKISTGSPNGGRSDVDRADRSADEKGGGFPVRPRGGFSPEVPQPVDTEFCWEDDRKR